MKACTHESVNGCAAIFLCRVVELFVPTHAQIVVVARLCICWTRQSSRYFSTLSTLCPPCSHFASAGGIAANLPHGLKPWQSHIPTTGGLFVVVDPSISCWCSRNEVSMEANKTWDSLDTHELPLLDTCRNGTYNKTEFTWVIQGIWKEREK